MSKQSEAKERQGYQAKPVKRECSTCLHFQFDMDWPKWMKDGRHDHYKTEDNMEETNLRCGIGGFAVKKTACCTGWYSRTISKP